MAEPIRTLQSLLDEYLPNSPFAEGLRDQSALDSWSDIVGEDIARHSNAVGIEGDTLLVAVESSVWAQELSLLKPEILRKLRGRIGHDAVRDIRFHSRSDRGRVRHP